MHSRSVTSAGRVSANRRIFHALGWVTAAGVLVKLVATGKELVVADVFGRGNAIDAFVIAFLIPGLLVNLFAESMNQALIPTLVRVREQDGQGSAQELLSSAMRWSAGLLVCGAGGLGLVARVVFPLVLRFPAEKLALTEHLFYGLLPVVLLAGLASNCTAVLNTEERFAVPALLPMVMPVAVIAAAWGLSGRLGIWSLVVGNVAGALVHAVAVGWMMHRHGYAPALRWGGLWFGRRTAALREVIGQYGPILLSGLLASGGLLVDQGMAATLRSGSVATLAYASRFTGVAMTLAGGALATAITPYFAGMVAKREWNGCRHTLNTYARLAAVASVPLVLAMILGSRWMIRLAFQHGAFHAGDTAAVAPVQAMYAIQLPFFVVSRVYYRYLLAIRRSRLILACGGLNLALDVVLNLVLMRWMGVAGIALATSLWMVSTLVFLAYWSYKLLPEENGVEL